MPESLTLPRLLRRNAREFGARPAMREKDRGIWRTYTWQESEAQVRAMALGLAAAGFQRGDKLAVIGDNRPRLYWAQLAAMCLGGVAVPLYQDSVARELAGVLEHAEVTVIVAEDQEQVDKILSLRPQLPALRLTAYDDPRGMSRYRFDWLVSLDELARRGRIFGDEHPDRFESEVEKGAADDLAYLCYTSGTTGKSKGAMLSHANVIATASAFASAEDLRREDNLLAYLPMAWVGDVVFSIGLNLLAGLTVNCPESPETVQRDLRELGPAGVLAPPRIWETLLTSVQVRAADATPVKRWVFERCRAIAERAEALRGAGQSLPPGLGLAYAVGERLVYRAIRDQLGLAGARWCYTGGAPLGADAFRFFRAFGVNLKQLYGATETTGMVVVQSDGEADPASAGRPAPGVEIRIGNGGEVLVKGPSVFKGYFKNDDATHEVLDREGWFHTGDAGFLDAHGRLVVIDRAKDVGALDNGASFAPQFIENRLKYSPFIREAVAFGHERPFVAAMIAIDLSAVGSWAERHGLAYTSYMDLSQKPQVHDLIRGEVGKCNAGLPDAIKVRRFVLLAKELDADDAEITRTRKVRRRFIADKYAGVIAAFYSGAGEAALAVTVTYEDGREVTIASRMAIVDVETQAEAPAHV